MPEYQSNEVSTASNISQAAHHTREKPTEQTRLVNGREWSYKPGLAVGVALSLLLLGITYYVTQSWDDAISTSVTFLFLTQLANFVVVSTHNTNQKIDARD